MNRIDLFEFEDFPWFPDWIRTCVTRLIVVMHKLLNTSDDLVPLIKKALNHSKNQHIIDLCSRNGGPMIAVYNELVEEHEIKKPEIKTYRLISKFGTGINNKQSRYAKFKL